MRSVPLRMNFSSRLDSRRTEGTLLVGGSVRFLVLEIGLDRTAELDGQGIAVAVDCLAGGDPDPAFADAIFLDIGLLNALEADADVARQRLGIEIGAARIVAEP